MDALADDDGERNGTIVETIVGTELVDCGAAATSVLEEAGLGKVVETGE